MKQASGAAEVLVFDHTIRVAMTRCGPNASCASPCTWRTTTTPPAQHRSGCATCCLQTVRKHCWSTASPWCRCGGRSRARCRTCPLAICDAQSIDARDFVLTDLVYTHRVGEVMQLSHNPGHRWFYFPDMDPGEALIFKTYESLADGRARFTAHTAFADPNAPADAHSAPEHRIPHPRLLRTLRVAPADRP